MSLIEPISCGSEPVEECCPVTFTGFCLIDGTPIGIIVEGDEQTGWINFETGVTTPGPPPLGVTACPSPTNTEQEILCDVDECDVTLATVLVVRTYDSNGVPSPPSYYDSITGLPYVIQGTLQVCDTRVTLCEPVVICPGTEPIPVIVSLDSTEDSVTVVQEPNVVSTSNSTSTPLPPGGTFTGVFEEVLPFADFTVLINTSHPSAVDGFKVEYSTNGIDVDATDVFTFVTADKKQYSFGTNSRYVRIRYTNGPIAQTTFRLQTIYKRSRGKPSSHKLDEGVVDNDDAELVKAILTGKREDGVYENVELSTQNSLKVALTDRSSQVLNRIHVDAFIENVSTFPTTIHTVTAGHIFYLMSIGVTALNASTTINGRLVIRDNLTIKIPYLVGQASAAPGPIAIAPAAFLEPIPFSTNVNIQQLGGVNTVSIYVVGYDEPI